MIYDVLEIVSDEKKPKAPIADEDLFEASIAGIDSCYIEHTNFDVILKTILGCISENRRKSGKQSSCLVEGHSDAGKTTLVEKIGEAYPPVRDARRIRLRDGSQATCDHVPVICLESPDLPLPKDILRCILEVLGDPFVDKRRSRNKMQAAVNRYLDVLGTLAIVVDEAQRPTDREGKLIQRSIATLYQQLHDQGVIVILVGLGRARALQMEDIQVGNRWSTPLRIDAYRWGDPSIDSASADFNRIPIEVRTSRAHFKGLVLLIVSEVKLGWAPDIDFRTDRDAFLVFFATLGLTGTVKKLFRGAIKVARRGGPPSSPGKSWPRHSKRSAAPHPSAKTLPIRSMPISDQLRPVRCRTTRRRSSPKSRTRSRGRSRGGREAPADACSRRRRRRDEGGHPPGNPGG